jgi:hypothetical protein
VLAALWADYVAVAPGVREIHDMLAAREPDGRVVNDHVALRTFDRGPLGLEVIVGWFEALGYRRFAPYTFPNKHLQAWGLVHAEPGRPRVFVSELAVERLSSGSRAIVARLTDAIAPEAAHDPAVLWGGRPWPAPSVDEVRALARESEYAAWLAVWGLRANHFTVSVGDLRHTQRLEAVLDAVEAAGHPLNGAGGRIKGSAAELLEQGSTVARDVEVRLADGSLRVPSCYYEFALRHVDPRTGARYDGFVAASADRIFESTDGVARA